MTDIAAIVGAIIYVRMLGAALPPRAERWNIEMSELSATNDDVPETVWGQYSTHILGLIVVAVIGLGTVVYRSLEDWSWVDSFYFSVVTLTTVGYGDLAPSSSSSKLFTVAYVLTGLSLLGAALNEMGKRRRQKRVARRAHRHES